MNVTIKLTEQDARVFETLLQNRYGGRKMKLETLLYKAIREVIAEQAELTLKELERDNPGS